MDEGFSPHFLATKVELPPPEMTLKRLCLLKIEKLVRKEAYRSKQPTKLTTTVCKILDRTPSSDPEAAEACLRILNWLCYDSESHRDALSDRAIVHNLLDYMAVYPSRSYFIYVLFSLLSRSHPRAREVVEITADACPFISHFPGQLTPMLIVHIYSPMLKNSLLTREKLLTFVENSKPMKIIELYLDYLKQMTTEIIRNKIKHGLNWEMLTEIIVFLYECAGIHEVNNKMRKINSLESLTFLPYATFRAIEFWSLQHPLYNDGIQRMMFVQLVVMLSESLCHRPTVLEMIRAEDPHAAKQILKSIEESVSASTIHKYLKKTN